MTLLLVLSPAIASAQTDEVDDYVKEQVARRRIPGLSLAVVRGGEVVFARGYGMANVELSVRATPESVYEIASGERWAYTDTNYLILGMIVEKVGGKSLAEFLAERIFRPLGMAATQVNDTLAIIPNRATGYVRRGGTLRIRDFISPTLAAIGDGEVVWSVLDLAKWDTALDTEVLLKRSTLQQMWTPARLEDGNLTGYGFGWAIGEQRGRKLVKHSGVIPGFNAHISRFAEDRLTVIVLANTTAAGAGAIAQGVADRFLPEVAKREGN
jgi:CubicO group peptidase (beta-lactamase class C family)